MLRETGSEADIARTWTRHALFMICYDWFEGSAYGRKTGRELGTFPWVCEGFTMLQMSGFDYLQLEAQ